MSRRIDLCYLLVYLGFVTIRLQMVADKTITLDEIRPWESVWNLKAMIQDKERIPAEQQILKFGDKVLKNGNSLSSYGIQGNASLLLSRLPGTIVCIK